MQNNRNILKNRKCAEFPRAGCVFRVDARNAAEHYEHFIISCKDNDPQREFNYKLNKISHKTAYNGNKVFLKSRQT